MGHTVLEIHRLATLFQRLESGEIRVPAYQRSFSWSNKQILRLIESVYKGYPIGTLVFWRTPKEVFETASPDITELPNIPERRVDSQGYPVTYIIDGVQRLSSLYNCLRWQAVDRPSKFNVVFDLDSKTFTHFDRNKLPDNCVHLSSVLSPTVFTQDRPKLQDSSDFQELLTAITDLRARFIDYEVVITTLADYNADEVFSIFELLNTTGLRLTRQEVLRARAKRAEQDS